MGFYTAAILVLFGALGLATPTILTDDFRGVVEGETAADDNFAVMKDQEHRNLQEVWQYELPPWWDYLQLNFEGINLRRCFKRQFPPVDDSRCSRNAKTCFFGNQRCPGIGQYPTVECFCNGDGSNPGTWSCADAQCPVATTFGTLSTPYRGLGQASITENLQGNLVVSNLGSSGEDGIQFSVVDLNGTRILGGPDLDGTMLPDGAFRRFESSHNDGSLSTYMHSQVLGDDVIVTSDFADIGTARHLVTIYLNDEEVASQLHEGPVDLTLLGGTMTAAAEIDCNKCSGEDGTLVYIWVWLPDIKDVTFPTVAMQLPNGSVHTGSGFSIKAIDPSVLVTSTEFASFTFKDVSRDFEVQEVSHNVENLFNVSIAPTPGPAGTVESAIAGNVAADTNNDDVGDVPLAGVQISLSDVSGIIVGTTVTDGNGKYELTGLPPGVYSVQELTPPGYDDVSDTDGGDPNTILVTILDGGVSVGNDFVDEAQEP